MRTVGDRPRVCCVFPHVGLGGGETAMMAVAEGLRDELRLDICALDQGPDPAGPLRGELAARFGEVTFLRRRWELRPRLARADAVLWYGVVPAVPAALDRLENRPASIRAVHTERGEDGPAFARRWGRVIDQTICVSPAIARRIPGAVFVPNTCREDHLRGPRQALFSPGRKTLGFLGRLAPLKNVPWLLENLAALGCNLAVQALDTPLLSVADLQALAARLGLGSRVVFLPPSRDVGTLLRSIDALVLPSQTEGFPMVVIEAGRVGTPVIATRVGALPEVFATEVLFIDSEGGVPSLPSLRAAVNRLDPSWGTRLQAKVSRLCSPEAVVGSYSQAIREALEVRAGQRAS